MTLGDTSLPRAVERALRFLGESEEHRLNLAATNFPMVVQGPEAFVARMFAPARPHVEFLATEDVRETMSWLARPRTHTEYVEVEKVVERRIYVPVETPAPAPAPKEEPKPAPVEKPFGGMDQAVNRAVIGSSIATLGLGSYLMGLAAPHATSSSFTGFDGPGVPFANMPFARPHHPFATITDPGGRLSAFGGPSDFGTSGYGGGEYEGTGVFFGGGGTSSISMPFGGGMGSPFIPLLGGLPVLGGSVGIVQRLAPVIEEAVQRANGTPAMILQLPGVLAATAMDRGVGPADQRSLQEAAGLAFRQLPQDTAVALGQISLVAPDLHLASPEAAQSGTAVSMAWQDLAPGAGPLDEAGVGRLTPLLPAQAQLIYPALPAGTPGATTFALAPSLIERLMSNYGPGVANAARSVAPQAAAAGRAATPMPGVGKRVPASIVPIGRPAAGPGGLFGGQGNPLEEAGGGQAKRGGSLDFLGVPVQLAPSLAGDPGVRQERSLAKAVSEVTGGAPARPEAFGLLRNRLFPSMGSVVAEPNLPAWQRRAQEVGLRDANPASLLAPDARSARPALGSKPQIDGGPIGQAVRPFAPALAAAEMPSQRPDLGNATPNLSRIGTPHVLSPTAGVPSGEVLGKGATGAGLPETRPISGVGVNSPMNIHRAAGDGSVVPPLAGIGHRPAGLSLIPGVLGPSPVPAPSGLGLPASPSLPGAPVPGAFGAPPIGVPDLPKAPSTPSVGALVTPEPGIQPRRLPHLPAVSDSAGPIPSGPLGLGPGVVPRIKPRPAPFPIGSKAPFSDLPSVRPIGLDLSAPGIQPGELPKLSTPHATFPMPTRGPDRLGISLPPLSSGAQRIEGTASTLPSMPTFPTASLPPPSAGPLRPSESMPAIVPPKITVSEAPAMLEMPVLRRPTLPTLQKSGPPALAAAGSAKIQFSKGSVGSLSEMQSPSSSGGQDAAPQADGAKVQLLAREVYGILRRRLRDEKERAHPYGGF